MTSYGESTTNCILNKLSCLPDVFYGNMYWCYCFDRDLAVQSCTKWWTFTGWIQVISAWSTNGGGGCIVSCDVCYRPPNSSIDFLHELNRFSKFLADSQFKDVVLSQYSMVWRIRFAEENDDAFNTAYVASVFTSGTSSSLPLISPSQSSSNFLDSIIVSEFEVQHLLFSLSPSKATGPDGIPAYLLKFRSHNSSLSLRVISSTGCIWSISNI